MIAKTEETWKIVKIVSLLSLKQFNELIKMKTGMTIKLVIKTKKYIYIYRRSQKYKLKI